MGRGENKFGYELNGYGEGRRRETLYIMAYRIGVLYGKGIMGRRRNGGAYHARAR
jgi:hypothetical protein